LFDLTGVRKKTCGENHGIIYRILEIVSVEITYLDSIGMLIVKVTIQIQVRLKMLLT